MSTDQTRPMHRLTWRVFLLCFAGAALLVGCRSSDDAGAGRTAATRNATDVGSRIEALAVPSFEPSGTVALLDLDIAYPLGWRFGDVSSEESGKRAVPLFTSTNARTADWQVRYEQVASILRDVPDNWLLEIRKNWPKPTDFLEQYETDLALVTAIHRARPGDLQGASGAQVKHIETLLLLQKECLGEWGPAKRVATKDIRAFVITAKLNDVAVGVANMYGLAGDHRGMLFVVGRDAENDPEPILAKLLARARYR